MTFPSIWLTVGFAVAYLVLLVGIGGFTAWWVARGAKEKGDVAGASTRAARLLTPAMEMASYFLPPLFFFAFTGSFPWTFSFVSVVLFAITATMSALIVSGSDIHKHAKDGDSVLLEQFFKSRYVTPLGCVLLLVMMGFYVFLLVQGIRTAARVDLSSPEGLFEVAIYVFLLPAAFTFATSWPVVATRLASAATPRQIRVETFARSVRQFVIGVWGLFYPFFAFRQDLMEANSSWLYLGAAAAIGVYLLTAVAPFELGRLGFARKERDALEHLRETSQALVVATEPGVSEEFRAHIFQRMEHVLDDVMSRMQGENASFSCLLWVREYPQGKPEADPNVAAADPNVSAAPAGLYGQRVAALGDGSKLDRVSLGYALAYAQRLPELDYRLYGASQVREMLRQFHDASWVRGVAMLTERAAARRLERREAKSILVASIGVVLASIVPLAQHEFDAEIRSTIRSAKEIIVSAGAPPTELPR